MPGGLICEMETFCVIFFCFVMVFLVYVCVYIEDSCKDKEAVSLTHWSMQELWTSQDFSNISSAELLFASLTCMGCHNNAINTNAISYKNYIYRAGKWQYGGFL